MAEYLVVAMNIGDWTKGDIARVRPDGWAWGGQEQLPKFVRVKCPGQAVNDIYHGEWKMIVAYETLNFDDKTDIYQVRMYSTLPGLSGEGNLTAAMVEGFLQNWGATVDSIAANEVTFTAGIYNAAISNRFWDIPDSVVSDLQFSEFSYVKQTGLHTIDVDVTQSDFTVEQVENYILNMGYTVIGTNENGVRFTVSRNNVFLAFKDNVAEALAKRLPDGRRFIDIRRYHVADATVDNIASQGGEISITEPQLFANLLDKTTE